MIYALIKKRRKFSLSMLKDGQTISRRQYKSLYEEIGICFSIFSKPNGDNMFCKIKREYELKPKEIFGQTRLCQAATSYQQVVCFEVEGTEPL